MKIIIKIIKFFKYISYLIILFNINLYSETIYNHVDPLIIDGELDNSTEDDKILKKILTLQDKNNEIRSKIISLQDLLVSRFKDRIELKIEVISEQDKKLPQFGFIELSAIMNNISILNFPKPLYLEKNTHFPLFSGPLPIGHYEISVRAIVGQLVNNWPYTLPQGKWSVEKKFTINGSLKYPIHDVKLYLKQNKETKMPEFELENNGVKEKKQ